MPYIVTTRNAADPPNDRLAVKAEILSRRAVATLEEAREEASLKVGYLRGEHAGWVGVEFAHAEWDAPATAAFTLPEQGGSIGPLPDGTVIEVEPIIWTDLCNTVWPDAPEGDVRGDAETIDAYNAAQEG